MDDATWTKLRRQVRREQKEWEGTKLNKEGRTVAAGMVAAYGGVLRMMDRLEASTGCERP